MELIGRALRSLLRHLKDTRGVSLYEITAAVAMTGILAAVAVPVIIDKVQEAKAARAIQETDSLYKAISAFQRDTGKMPGEVEHFKLLITSTSVGTPTPLPDLGDGVLAVVGGGCTGPTAMIPAIPATPATRATETTPAIPATPATPAKPATLGSCGNVNDFLVRNPNTISALGTYQNWRGPYVDEITSDPFDRSYIVNIRALYTAEDPLAGNTSNTCGYGWVLSGGPNRTLETSLGATNFASTSDDIGKNNGKKQPPGTGCH